ncbi:hypothetical protein ACFLRX_00850 [Acidobacteriota bacterium]
MKKFKVTAIFAVTVILTASIFSCRSNENKVTTPEELAATIEVIDIETKWVEKEYQPWPPKLTLVPTISFRIKNLTDMPLKYVYFNAIFRIKDEEEIAGDAFLAAIRNVPVKPGEISDTIFLKSNYGVEGKNLSSFGDNYFWEIQTVKLFAKFKGSSYIPAGEWEVSRNIDFKEPEPVLQKDPKEKKDDKE